MTFKEQISFTARVGARMFAMSVLLLILSRVIALFNTAVVLGFARVFFFLGLLLMISAVGRSFAKRRQRKFENNGWTHPFATVGPLYRWYYWVDKDGKDRDA